LIDAQRAPIHYVFFDIVSLAWHYVFFHIPDFIMIDATSGMLRTMLALSAAPLAKVAWSARRPPCSPAFR
jgi:hypothetical protein